MNRLIQLKADKAPILIGVDQEEINNNLTYISTTLWSKVAKMEYNINSIIDSINGLKSDLIEKISTNSLVVTGISVFNGDSSVKGTLNIDENLIVDGTSTLTGNISTSGNLIVSGNITSSGGLTAPQGISTDYIKLNTNPVYTSSDIGTIYYDTQDKTLSVIVANATLQIGQETYIVCLNKTGSTISNGSVVYINGAQGNRPTIALAYNTSYNIACCTIGVATHDITNNQEGMITVFGLVRDLNTSSLHDGYDLYLGSTPGSYTETKPSAGIARIRIGRVIKTHASDGWIGINISNDKYMFGNVDGGNYSMFEDDGTLVAKGDARTYRDEIADITKLKVVGVGIADNTTENAMTLQTTANLADYLYCNVQLNHERDLTANIYPHIHWFQTTSGNPNFLLHYRWQINGLQKVSGWTYLKCNTPAFTYVSGTLCQKSYSSGITPPPGSNLSDIVQFRIYRDNSNSSSQFTGSDPVGVNVDITSFDTHFVSDTNGSRTEYSK